MKSTGAVCEEKAGARRPGQASPSGDHIPDGAGTGHAEALTSAASAAAPAGVQAGREAMVVLAGAQVALADRCGASS